MTFSFLWYDLETWGLDAATSFIVSFACQRTNYNLEPIGQPIELICRPPEDCLPDPEAIVVHGISPQRAQEEGIPEYEFARAIHKEFNKANTCVVGFNNIRFDDEFCRYLFYRNLLDPYSHQWRNRNSRWDVLDMFRVCYAFKPDTMKWQNNAQGEVSFALQAMASANDIEVSHAHDALSDVDTTIALAKYVKDRQPDMFDYLFTIRGKKKISEILHDAAGKPMVHVSRMFSVHQGKLSLVVPLAYNKEQRQKLYVFDLNSDSSSLLSLSASELSEVLFTPRDELPEDIVLPMIKTLHLNRCPVLLPAKMLSREVADRLGIDLDYCQENYKVIDDNRQEVALKVQEVYDASEILHPSGDVNVQLYDGLFSDKDRLQMDRVHQIAVEEWGDVNFSSDDERISELWLRLKARYVPEIIDVKEKEHWKAYLQRLYTGQIDRSSGALDKLMRAEDLLQAEELSDTQKGLLSDLEQYIHSQAALLGVSLD